MGERARSAPPVHGHPAARTHPDARPDLPTDAHGLLLLQRAAGNRATAAWVQRAPVRTQGTVSGYEFVVGTELTAAFAAAAKVAVRGPVGTAQLSTLRTAALVGDESVSDHERMFMAGLLDAGNATALRRSRFRSVGDRITFPAATITTARRTAADAVDRAVLPSGVAGLEQSAAAALRRLDLLGAIHLMNAANLAAVTGIVTATGPFSGTAARAMAVALSHGLFPLDLLKGMTRAASDGTPGDLALAAVALTIAHVEGLASYDDLAVGRIKVDQVPAAAMPGGPSHNADYVTVAHGGGSKGDTIYLPSGLNIDNAYQWSVVVHELHHAADDRAAGSGPLTWTDKAQLELNGFRAQGGSILRRLAATSGPDRATMITQIAAELDPLLLAGMLVASRSSRAVADPLIVAVNQAMAPARQIPSAALTGLLATAVATIESRVLALIAQTYGLAPGAQAPLDGLSGESVVDWINRV